ncbi:hypothetical protein NEOLEDRAFT_1246636 [Neolentinus lepideus HHB14362 ss-1]|uniref:Uncharacterized protein n=1 Tax=Neolentinus lepideus HHB14362 ss-1 TaxID=1314782 RepID=A0A165M6H6_9AGAM|nr:hypothetical protein NEOLEDRAFT_1246636 [Neolentinus lepideus HHB14362 ss-1]
MDRDAEHERRRQNIQRAIPVRSEKPESQHNTSTTHADSNDGSHPVVPRVSASPKCTQPPASTPSSADADKSIVSFQQPVGPSEESSATTVREDNRSLSPLIIPTATRSDDDNRPELTGSYQEMEPKAAEQDDVPKIATEEQSQVFAIETAGDTVLSDSQLANVPETADARPRSIASCDGALQTQPENVEHDAKQFEIWNEIYARAFAQVLAEENAEVDDDYESEEEQPCPPRVVRPATEYSAMDICFQTIDDDMMLDAPVSEEVSGFADTDMSILEDLFELQDTCPMEIEAEAEAEPMSIDSKDGDEDGDVSMMTVEPAAVMEDAVAELCKLLNGCLLFH